MKSIFLTKIPLEKLYFWDKNFRDISTEAFARLKNKIKELGVFKPLLAIAGKEDGTTEHLLICADSTERSAINLLMGGLGADLVLTDPPYNMNYQGAEIGQEESKKEDLLTCPKCGCTAPKRQFKNG